MYLVYQKPASITVFALFKTHTDICNPCVEGLKCLNFIFYSQCCRNRLNAQTMSKDKNMQICCIIPLQCLPYFTELQCLCVGITRANSYEFRSLFPNVTECLPYEVGEEKQNKTDLLHLQ